MYVRIRKVLLPRYVLMSLVLGANDHDMNVITSQTRIEVQLLSTFDFKLPPAAQIDR